jgi:hypothetical protein
MRVVKPDLAVGQQVEGLLAEAHNDLRLRPLDLVHQDGEPPFEDFDRRLGPLHPGQQPFAHGGVVAAVNVDACPERHVLDDAGGALEVFRGLVDAVAERGHAVLGRLVLVHRRRDEHDVILGLILNGGAAGDIQDVVDVAVLSCRFKRSSHQRVSADARLMQHDRGGNLTRLDQLIPIRTG